MLVEINYGKHIQGEVIDFTMHECGGCGIPFFAPTKWLNKKMESNGSFNCPNGCNRVFVGKTEADKLKDELRAMSERAIKKEEELQNKWLDALGEKNKLEKQLKKVHNGTCPCCKRSFQNLERHMQSKHPELVKVKRIKP